MDPLIGTTIDGRYEVEAQLGKGGMGVVYRARHVILGKQLAVKVLKPDVSKDEEIITRFRQEAQSASAIGSQHIIDISDFGTLPDGSTYFVMELLDGNDLTHAIEKEQPLGVERIVNIAKQLCDALGAAHERGIVHRDLKPDNIFLVPRGGTKDFVKVLDFGIAKVGGASSKLTRAGQVFGTPHYMSPEQCSGGSVDHRTDIYALGVILYEMACGRVPFDADNLMGILTKHMYEQPIPLHELPPPVNVPAGLEAVILKCLAKTVDTRYASMGEVKADLESFEAGLTPQAVLDAVDRQSNPRRDPTGRVSAMQVEVGGEIPAEPSSSKLPLILGAFALLGVLGAGAIGLYFLVLAPSDTPPAPDPNVLARADSIGSPIGEGEGTAEEAEGGEEGAATADSEEEEEETTAAPETPPVVMVTLTTEPSGAEVYRGDTLLGNTPFELPRPTGEDTLALTLRNPGYGDHSLTLSSLTSPSVSVRLVRERRRSQGSSGSSRVQPRQPEPQPQATPPSTPPPRQPRIGGTEVLDPWAR